MPLSCPMGKIRYRWKKTKKGKIRLAFCGNEVVEVKKKGGKAKKVRRKSKKRKYSARDKERGLY